MITNVRLWIASITLVAVFSLIYLSGPSQAAQDKDLKASVKKIADALKKGDKDEAKKLAAAVAKDKALVDEITDVMHMFRKRDKGGIGVGSKPLGNPAKDGIELMIRDLARDVPGGVAKQAAALEEMGYTIAALGELSNAAIAKAPTGTGKKTKKAWAEMSEEMRELGGAFAKAAAAKGAQEIKTAAAKINENCNRCHTIFKD